LKKIEIELLTSHQTLELGDLGFRRRKIVRRAHGGRADGGRRRLSRHGPKSRPLVLAGPPTPAIEPGRPQRPIRLKPLIKRTAKHPRRGRQRPHRLAGLGPANKLSFQFRRKGTQNSHDKAPLDSLVHQLPVSHFRGPLHFFVSSLFKDLRETGAEFYLSAGPSPPARRFSRVKAVKPRVRLTLA